jgi:hypothetical protein
MSRRSRPPWPPMAHARLGLSNRPTPSVTRIRRISAPRSRCGVFWGTKGLGAAWLREALTLLGILAMLLVVSGGRGRMVQRMLPQGAHKPCSCSKRICRRYVSMTCRHKEAPRWLQR